MKNNLENGSLSEIITEYLKAEDRLEFCLSFMLLKFKSKSIIKVYYSRNWFIAICVVTYLGNFIFKRKF